MILCEDWSVDPDNPRRINILGLLSSIRLVENQPYPLLLTELCVLLALADGRGQGRCRIVCRMEDTGQRMFATPWRTIRFGDDPLEVTAVPFRIRDCLFPVPGLYTIEFWYNDRVLEERPLLLR
jgi:hypothetical protein